MSATYRFSRDQVLAAAQRGARNAVNAIALELQNEIKRNLSLHASNRSSGGNPSPPGMPPGKATGTLGRSWGAQAVKDTSGLNDPIRPRMAIGSNLVYARIHEYGGTIHGKPNLAIPIHPEAKRAAAQGLGPRSFGGRLQLIERPGKPPLLVRFVSVKRTRYDIMYVLLRSVRLPPRPYLAPSLRTVRAKAAAIAGRIMDAALRRFRANG